MSCWRFQARCVVVAGALMLLGAQAARGEIRSVGAGGNLQAALNAALPGDVILLEPGALFRGRYTLPAKDNPQGLFITVRSAAADEALPPAGTRITPASAPYLPVLQS